MDPQRRLIYVSSTGQASNSVSVVDADSHGVRTTLPVGEKPTRIAIDEASGMVLVLNSGATTVTRIDGDALHRFFH